MANFFGTYAFDIWEVASKRGVDVGVGFDMFRVDIANGRPQNCGDALPGFDWHAARDEWDKLDVGAKSAAVNGWVEISKRHYDELCRAYPQGRAAMDKVIAEG